MRRNKRNLRCFSRQKRKEIHQRQEFAMKKQRKEKECKLSLDPEENIHDNPIEPPKLKPFIPIGCNFDYDSYDDYILENLDSDDEW